MSEVVLKVENLMMQFGGIRALSDVSLQVKRNSIFALIGPNGAGKTTVFNCLTGFYKAFGDTKSVGRNASPNSLMTLVCSPRTLSSIFPPEAL